MFHVYKSEVSVAVISKTLASIQRLKIVELFGPVLRFGAGGSKAEGSSSYNYRFHIVTRFKS